MYRLLVILLILIPNLLWAAKVEVTELRTEGMCNPLGVNTLLPRLSWKMVSKQQNVKLRQYQILAASSMERLNEKQADLWNSGVVTSDAQLNIVYGGKPLTSNQQVFWMVRVNTSVGQSEWSEPTMFSVGIKDESYWSGQWIGWDHLAPGDSANITHSKLCARYVRKEFKTCERVKRAMAYVAGLGLYEMYVNGKRVGDRVLTPVPTDYRRTVIYNTYDITSLLDSVNAVGLVLGNGRFFAPRQDKPHKNNTFGLPKCRVNILIEYEDNKRSIISTDETWKICMDGPIRANNEYDGETYDARKELGKWTCPHYDDTKWNRVQRVAIPTGTLCGTLTPGMKVIGKVKPQRMVVQTADRCIIDMGENFSGWLRTSVRGSEGHKIQLLFAEKLTPCGDSLYTANLRNARVTDLYICNGTEKDCQWHPVFVTHGFRYVEVTGLKNAQLSDFMGEKISDEMQQSGTFSCNDTILNKVYQNAVRGIVANYKGMPIDCPQRNERQPWLGDRTVGALGESFIVENSTLYAKWMRDISESQRSDGCIPDVAPSFWNYFTDDVSWPAAFPFICDMLYEQYGDERVIAQCYPNISRWMLHILDRYSKDGLITKDKYGDWCMPPEDLKFIHSQDPQRKTDGSLIATAYTIRCLQLLSKFAEIQGKTDDAGNWAEQRAQMVDRFNEKWLHCKQGTSPVPGHPLYPDSVYYSNNTATANLLAIAFGIVPDSLRSEVTKNVVANIILKNGGVISTGVIGSSFLMRGLSDNGFADVAYLLATNKNYPSWGYMAENGATTIWELWNGDKANPSMNSGNHVMLLGDLVTWCYQYLGGIRNAPGSVAYKHFLLKPAFDIEEASWADVSYNTPYGKIVSRWQKNLQHVEWDVEVPVNTTAQVFFPDGHAKTIGSGTYHFSSEIPALDKRIVKDEFLYEHASFPSCHASTISELKNGDLVVAYFGGTYERHPDVCIWVSRKPKGQKVWTAPQLAADGVFRLGSSDALLAGVDSTTTSAEVGPVVSMKGKNLKRKACWNPVLYQMPDGTLYLFYKIGLNVKDWTGWYVSSTDNGKTWTERKPLPKGFLGPVKNKPELVGDQLICPSSTESGGWRIHFEILDLKTKAWKYVGPIKSKLEIPSVDLLNPDAKKKDIICIQPSILKHRDGRLQVLCRTRNGKLATSWSNDNGNTWSDVELTELPNNNSGTDAVTLKDGRHVLVYNDFGILPGTSKGVRTPLSLAESRDGVHWTKLMNLEDSPISQYSYPSIIQGKDGNLHIVYTWRRQRVAYKEIDLSK